MISARDIASRLGGKWGRNSSSVCCPAHDDRTPSLSISQTRDGRPLVFCHAGCSQQEVISALRKLGLWEGDAKFDPSYPGRMSTLPDGHARADDRRNQEYARDLWERADRIKGTLAELYLRSRGIHAITWPDSLGYLPNLMHKPSNQSFPCLIGALTENSGRVVAIQRTWLDPSGTSKAQVEGAVKMTLGPMGKGSVRLGKPQAILGIAEGIETALSARQIYQLPVWATLSANRLGQIEFPECVESLVIFADHGKVGMEAACEAAEVYEAKGLAVDVMPPRVHFGDAVSDFNDVVRANP